MNFIITQKTDVEFMIYLQYMFANPLQKQFRKKILPQKNFYCSIKKKLYPSKYQKKNPLAIDCTVKKKVNPLVLQKFSSTGSIATKKITEIYHHHYFTKKKPKKLHLLLNRISTTPVTGKQKSVVFSFAHLKIAPHLPI